ncbi:MAG: MmgE/PrpD family protein [Candidatus Thorarchaeota archaeon]|jgi:2-methylcitrate dehydratase
MTVAQKMGEMSEKTTFKDITDDAIRAAKQLLLDTIGCIVGGYNGQSSNIVRQLIVDFGEKGKSTILVDGTKTSARNATLVNGVMARVLDFNDVYCGLSATHPNEPVIPAALAVGEERGVNGEDLLTAIVLGYEFDMRMADIVPEIGNKGFSETASMGQYITPLVAGRLMGLDSEKIAHAIGISGCHNVSLGGVWYGEVSLTKQIMNAFSAQSGVFAAYLAERGFTGPKGIIEGEKGFFQTVVGDIDQEKLTEPLTQDFRINKSWIKKYPCVLRSASPIDATIPLVEENNLSPKDIKEVIVKTYTIAVEETSGPKKIRPSTIPEAQFSLHYAIACAIKDRTVATHQFTQDYLQDPEILDLATKVKAEIDPEMERLYPEMWPATVEITTVDGNTFSKQVNYQTGHHMNPMTDDEVNKKFKALVQDILSEEKVDAVIEFISSLEKKRDISELMEILTA